MRFDNLYQKNLCSSMTGNAVNEILNCGVVNDKGSYIAVLFGPAHLHVHHNVRF